MGSGFVFGGRPYAITKLLHRRGRLATESLRICKVSTTHALYPRPRTGKAHATQHPNFPWPRPPAALRLRICNKSILLPLPLSSQLFLSHHINFFLSSKYLSTAAALEGLPLLQHSRTTSTHLGSFLLLLSFLHLAHNFRRFIRNNSHNGLSLCRCHPSLGQDTLCLQPSGLPRCRMVSHSIHQIYRILANSPLQQHLPQVGQPPAQRLLQVARHW